MQIQAPRNRVFDVMELIQTTVNCHIEVLMHTALHTPQMGS